MPQNIELRQDKVQVYNQYIQSGNTQQALDLINEVLINDPDSELKYMKAPCLKGLGMYEAAYLDAKSLLATSIPLSHKINLWDVLAHASWMLRKADEAKHYGVLALQAKSDLPATAKTQILPSSVYVNSKPNHFGAWVIAFSLYGGEPRYTETAILNVYEARKWLPDWVCRFYCDSSVPASIILRLQNAGAQVHLVNSHLQKSLQGTFWRMLVADDPTVERFLQRDADSIISQKEALAVNEWVESGKLFHVMRDWWSHSELLLAGMWGGCTIGLKGMSFLIQDFLSKNQRYVNKRTTDQLFLRTSIWPTVKQSLFTHDSCFCFFDAKSFPKHDQVLPDVLDDFHVGMNLGTCPLEVKSDLSNDALFHWMIHDGEQEICRYSSKVQNGTWQTLLPQTFYKPLINKLWNVCPQDQPNVHLTLLRPKEIQIAVSSFILSRNKS